MVGRQPGPGPEPVIKALAASFSKKYPNVKVNLKFYSFTNYIKIIKLSLNSGNAPDVAEGNQGFQIDSALVKAKLIKPLDSYATKYGWNKEFSAGTAQQFRWTNDGKTYGKGPLWGVAQFGQSTGVFYNKALLKKYGGDPSNMPKTFADFSKLLATLKAKAPSSMPIINLGNKDGYESLHAFGMVQGAYTTGQFMRNWIFHVPGSTYESPANLKALTTFQQWFKDGYFGSDYNALGENDASASFAKGKGVFYLGGNWQAAVIAERPQGQRRVHGHAPGRERQVRRDRRHEPALAHLGEVEVSRRRRRVHQLADRRPGLGADDVRPEPDPGRLDRAGRQGQRVPELDRHRLAAARQERRPHALPRLGLDEHADRDEHGVPEDDRPAPDAGGHRQDDPERMDDVR